MTLISEFLFSSKESTYSGSKYFKPPSQKQMVAPSCFDTLCYKKLESLNGKNLRKRFSDIATYIGTFNNPLRPFRNLSSHIVFDPPFRHQLTSCKAGAYMYYGNISSSYSILGGMPFVSHASLLRQPNVGYRLRP